MPIKAVSGDFASLARLMQMSINVSDDEDVDPWRILSTPDKAASACVTSPVETSPSPSQSSQVSLHRYATSAWVKTPQGKTYAVTGPSSAVQDELLPFACRFCSKRFGTSQARGGHESTVHKVLLAEARRVEGSEFWEQVIRKAETTGSKDQEPEEELEHEPSPLQELVVEDEPAVIDLEDTASSLPAKKKRKDGLPKNTCGSASRTKHSWIKKSDTLHHLWKLQHDGDSNPFQSTAEAMGVSESLVSAWNKKKEAILAQAAHQRKDAMFEKKKLTRTSLFRKRTRPEWKSFEELLAPLLEQRRRAGKCMGTAWIARRAKQLLDKRAEDGLPPLLWRGKEFQASRSWAGQLAMRLGFRYRKATCKRTDSPEEASKSMRGLENYLDANPDFADNLEHGRLDARAERILLSQLVGEAFNEISQAKFRKGQHRYFEKTGCLITLDGSDDHLIQIEGLDGYKPYPAGQHLGPNWLSTAQTIFTGVSGQRAAAAGMHG
eukprot:Skav200068  [mRNA]  locus=scaffold838:156307:158572:- [translate_table: standard]